MLYNIAIQNMTNILTYTRIVFCDFFAAIFFVEIIAIQVLSYGGLNLKNQSSVYNVKGLNIYYTCIILTKQNETRLAC